MSPKYFFSIFLFYLQYFCLYRPVPKTQRKILINRQKITKTKPPIIKKPASSYNDTIIVTTARRCFIAPILLQMEKIKAGKRKSHL